MLNLATRARGEREVRLICRGLFFVWLVWFLTTPLFGQRLAKEELKLVKAVEQQRIAAINKVIGSVIAIYDEDRQGGGSGVIIDPSGIALTNHHVIMGAGVAGWGGLDDGKLYKWKLIGTDPGGDVSIIQMEGRDDFPFTPLGDSDDVRVGDWALAMGNPFILTEDQKPTVTLGIVSGVKRYQYGAGRNQLVYGNCIQVDSSINPGNSGGPLFNMFGQVIGINGRGSFQDRGRVNVGLGYAISSNQIKNFIPELLATKLVEHGTLDANFSDRDGKVVCSTINELGPIYEAGLRLEDQLLEFEGVSIDNANQFTNLICTLPEDWPAHLKVKSKEGQEKTIFIRLLGLPYSKPKSGKQTKDQDEGDSEEQKRRLKRKQEMIALLRAAPGTIRFKEINRHYVSHYLTHWGGTPTGDSAASQDALILKDEVHFDGDQVATRDFLLHPDGKFSIKLNRQGAESEIRYDGKTFARTNSDGFEQMTLTEAKLTPAIVEAIGILVSQYQIPYEPFGIALMDGSDKTNLRNSVRFKVTDVEKDWFYFWTAMYDEKGKRSARLLKASPDIDCEEEPGICFHDWKIENGWQIPMRRSQVRGLGEVVERTINVTMRSFVPRQKCEGKFSF